MARYNRNPNPAFDNNTNGWGTQGTKTAPRRVTNYARPDGVTGCFVDANSSGRSSAVIFTNNSDGRPEFVPGRTYTVSIYVYQGSGSSRQVILDVDFYTRSGQHLSTAPGSPIVWVSNTTWTRISHTVTAPQQGDLLSTWVVFDTTSDNTYVGVTCSMVEDGPSSPAYADGDYTGWAWTGTRGNSPSQDLDPTAVAGVASPAQPVTPGATVQLSATGSANPEGGQVTCLWSVTDAGGTGLTNGSLSSRTAAFPTFTAPEGPATVTFGLTVTDITGNTDSTTVAVEIAGPAGPEPGRMLLAT